MSVFTVSFWRDSVERAIATAAQSAIGIFFIDSALNASVTLEQGLAGVGVATALSVLKALAATRKDDTVSPASLAPASTH